MVDYSRVDWKRCKLKPLPCLMADGETQQLTVQAVWDESHGNAVITVSGYHMMAKTGSGSIGWKFLHCDVASTADQALELVERAKEVNSFIATETARIEAEDSWVKIPWQDIEYLESFGIAIYHHRRIPRDREIPINQHGFHCADRRVFPAGYDPEKPRWVEVDSRDVTRLEKAGCAIRVRLKEPRGEWVRRFVVYIPPSDSCDYQVDAHTLKPGVPLHEEPKPAVKFVPVAACDVVHLINLGVAVEVEIGGKRERVYGLVRSAVAKYFVNENALPIGIGITPEEPKPAPRPCSKEFALAHPKESEARYVGGEMCTTTWANLDAFRFGCHISDYEFRTTARAEPKSMVVAEVAVTSLTYNEKVTNRMPLRIWREVVVDFGNDGQDARGKLHIHLGYDDREIGNAIKGKNPRVALIVDEVE